MLASPFTTAGLFSFHQSSDFVPLPLYAFDNLLIHRLVELRFAAKDPEVVPAGLAHHRPPVLRVKVDNPVVAAERPEEGHLQLGVGSLRVSHPSGPLGGFEAPIRLAAFINDGDFPI